MKTLSIESEMKNKITITISKYSEQSLSEEEKDYLAQIMGWNTFNKDNRDHPKQKNLTGVFP